MTKSKFAFGLIGLALLTGAGTAEAAGANWGGFHIGGSVGLNGVSATETDTITPPGTVTTFSGGPSWGAEGSLAWGYDFRLAPGLILGTFSTLDVSNAEVTVISPASGDINKLQQNWAYNSGARLGAVVSPQTLLYVDGGYSRSGFTFKYDTAGAGYSNGHVFTGWFAGVGAEHKISDHMGVSLDYRFARYGQESVGICEVCVVPTETHDIAPDVQTLRVGLVYNVGG
jgi:outer membrane immunogenic protein